MADINNPPLAWAPNSSAARRARGPTKAAHGSLDTYRGHDETCTQLLELFNISQDNQASMSLVGSRPPPNLDTLPSAYSVAAQCFEQVHYEERVSSNFAQGMLKFHHLHLRLTRWGAALGLDTVDPNTDVRSLAASHPMRKVKWSRENVKTATEGLDSIQELFKDFDKRHDRNTRPGVALADLDTKTRARTEVRLCCAMSAIAIQRRASLLSNHGANILLRETKESAVLIENMTGVIDVLIKSFPHLDDAQASLAQHETSKFLQCGVDFDDLSRFRDGGANQDHLLHNALVEELIKQKTGDAKVVWNIHSYNYGIQTSHIAGGTFRWNSPSD
ncbi:hypothetical protein FH972_024667 [Carpinus fangiana]|uniref:Prion-inhibition and propagation HeLo domain-containing protein n=1 Tax=Carpinus fangiana TaxID=176857 RepID=A0A5N6KYN6_9ROSI|nr:hypothetical protein FH972_024667 [Carpinus fangiana]